MVDPDMAAKVAAYTPEQLRRELVWAHSTLNAADLRACYSLACLLKQSNSRSARTGAMPLQAVAAEIKEALEGDSNDAEHDALVSVAEHLGISWQPPNA
ncbi:MAG TPA: hypothetical protein VGL57_13425 [Solirubrobacteraceae bacterium]